VHARAACNACVARGADRGLSVSLMTNGILLILTEEIPGLSSDCLETPFDRLAIDKFGLVSLRARLEQHIGHKADDELWTSARTPADLISMFSPQRTRNAHAGDAKASRSSTSACHRWR